MRILWGLYKASFSGSQRQHPAPSARQQPHVRHNGINCNSHASAFTNDNHEGKESNHDRTSPKMVLILLLTVVMKVLMAQAMLMLMMDEEELQW